MPKISALSSGVLARIMSGEVVDKPVLQILGAKKIGGGDVDRLRLLTSDGKYINSFAMLATQLNDLHADGKLAEYTIIQVDKYITSVVNKTDPEKRVLIILELTVLNPGSEVGHKIGEPVPYTESSKENNSKILPLSKNTSTSTVNTDTKTTSRKENFPSTSLKQNLTHPISSLSPYQNKWVIKARVMSKSAIRTWSNARGEGKLFNMDLMDESGEIRATAFKDQCDKYYDMIEIDKVYYISRCQIKAANKTYSTLKNDYEMSFTGETVVELCDEANEIPEIKYEFIRISEVANLEAKTPVDTIGVCKEIGELQTFVSRASNKEFKKRDLILVDSSDAAVTLTLWGDEAVNFDGYVQPVVLVKGARVNEFNGGKSLSMGGSAILKINPDIPEGHKLRGWFDNGGGENISTMVSARTGGGNFSNTPWLTFFEASANKLGCGDKPDYFQCKALVHIIKTQNAFYKACPQADCNKKVIDEGIGYYRCERCNSQFNNFKYRLLLNMSIGDWTSNRWVTCFSEVSEQLLKRTAQEVGEALENDPVEAEHILQAINFHSYVFTLRSKMEVYGDTQRIKFTVQSVSPVNYKEYNKHLIENLKRIC